MLLCFAFCFELLTAPIRCNLLAKSEDKSLVTMIMCNLSLWGHLPFGMNYIAIVNEILNCDGRRQAMTNQIHIGKRKRQGAGGSPQGFHSCNSPARKMIVWPMITFS